MSEEIKEWKLIETAPIDGSHVQLYRPDIQFVGYYGGANSGWRINAPGLPAMFPPPTHWAELQMSPNNIDTPPQEPASTVSMEPLSDTYIQRVPDKCDRIVWRNGYYRLQNLHLRSEQLATLQAKVQEAESKQYPDYGIADKLDELQVENEKLRGERDEMLTMLQYIENITTLPYPSARIRLSKLLAKIEGEKP